MTPAHARPNQAISDADLVRAACAGNASSLGVLLERHRPRLVATAIRLLGYQPDAEDAVQDACLIALRYLPTLRDPDSVGAWLHAIVRRSCLQLRRRRRGEVLIATIPDIPDPTEIVESRIEQMQLRDWIWAALRELPEVLRVSAMLRYFGSYHSYDEIAAILGIPIGTVRSRLSQAKLKLADALFASAGLIDDDQQARSHAHSQFWRDAVHEIYRRGDSDGFVRHCEPNLQVAWGNGRVAAGREHLAAEIEGDLAAGVRLDLERVLANDGIAVLEGRFTNPPESPDHCPPGIALVMFGRDERKSHVRMYLSPRPPIAGEE